MRCEVSGVGRTSGSTELAFFRVDVLALGQRRVNQQPSSPRYIYPTAHVSTVLPLLSQLPIAVMRYAILVMAAPILFVTKKLLLVTSRRGSIWSHMRRGEKQRILVILALALESEGPPREVDSLGRSVESGRILSWPGLCDV